MTQLQTTGLLPRPGLGEPMFQLRDFQQDAYNAGISELQRVQRTVLILPTGTGKTIVAGYIARHFIEQERNVLVLAHTRDLVHQFANKLDHLGIDAGIEMAGQYARSVFDPYAVVGSVQSFKGARLEQWDPDHFSLIIVDEGHHIVAPTYKRILKHFRSAKVLGITATIERGDEVDLGNVFDSVAYKDFTLWEAINRPEPALSRLLFQVCPIQIDLRGLKKSKEDWTDADMAERITPHLEVIANAIRQEVGDRCTMVFCPDVRSAKFLATAMRDNLGMAWDWTSGEDPDRNDKIEKYRRGETQGMCGCDLFIEGFDLPRISALVLCRSTKVRARVAQMIGRGTRLSPGKTDCLVIDFDWLTEEHDIRAMATDIFDHPNMDDEVPGIAADKAKAAGGPVDMCALIAEAEAEHEERQAARAKEFALRVAKRQVKYQKVSYNPFEIANALGIPWRGSHQPCTDPIKRATPNQVDLLTKLGVENAGDMSRARASTMLDYTMPRRKANLATPKQVVWLLRTGVEPALARSMTMTEASDYLGNLWGNKRS